MRDEFIIPEIGMMMREVDGDVLTMTTWGMCMRFERVGAP